MNRPKTTVRRLRGPGAAALLALAAGCGAAAGGTNGSGHPPPPPTGLTATAGVEANTLTWSEAAGADGYAVYWSTEPDVGPGAAAGNASVAAPPFLHDRLRAGLTMHYVVTARAAGRESGASAAVAATPAAPAIDPTWASRPPRLVRHHTYAAGLSEQANGAALRAAMLQLTAGERLEIGAGTYSVADRLTLDLQGSASEPIWIAAARGAEVTITRPDATQNVVNVGTARQARYLVLQDLEIRGGDTGIKLYACSQIWIDRCHVHHLGGAAITANAADTDHLFITRNEIHDPGGTAEGLYLGADDGSVVTHHSIVARNLVHHCAGSQGDGVELKQGSYANWIVDNRVHDCRYPCILVYGTGGREVNVIERNVCYRSADNVMQVQGEAIVRNNLLVAGAGSGFASHDHRGPSRDLRLVHNTIVTGARGASLEAWSGRPGMVFANNVVYSRSGEAIRFGNGSLGVAVAGNVVVGAVSGAAGGWLTGNGLADFAALAWDGSELDPLPTAASPLVGAADPAHAAADDLLGTARTAPYDAGCRER